MKKFTLFAALLVLFCGTSLAADDFDWSQCWCNYGGGIEKGDFIINADVGFMYEDFSVISNGFWLLPPVIVDVQYAQPIWKLPFTFGGFAGVNGHGYRYYDYYDYVNNVYVYGTRYWWNIFFGAEAAYHAKLPVDTLDVYIITRLGVNIPITNGYTYFGDYILFGEAIGINWFFTDKVALNTEIGYPFTKVGATFKF